MLNLPGFVSVLCHVFPSRDGFTGKWCGGWDSNPRRPTPQDFSCEPDLKSSPVRSCERSCPFDLNPATIGRGPVHGLGYPRVEQPLTFSRFLKLRIFPRSRVCARIRSVQGYPCANGVSLLVQAAMGRVVSGS